MGIARSGLPPRLLFSDCDFTTTGYADWTRLARASDKDASSMHGVSIWDVDAPPGTVGDPEDDV